MTGQLNIRRNNNMGNEAPIYQVRYEDQAGNSFAGSMDGRELHDLLYWKLAIDASDETLDREYERLLAEGHITFGEIDLRESELAGAGLKFLPAEG